MLDRRHFSFAATVIVVAVYIATRFWNLTASCLWFDEIFSVHATEHSWNTLFSFVVADLIHPPLSYMLLKVWITAGGESLLWLRLFPVTFAILALVPFLLLCRELKLSRSTQALALFLFATNGALIKYSQEVRMYSMLVCLSLFSIWLFACYFFKGKSLVLLIIVNILLIYTHYFGWFILMTEVLAILMYQRIKWRQMFVMFGICFIAFLPWTFTVWNAAHSGSELSQNIGWMQRPRIYELSQFVLDLIEPFYYQASSVDPASIYRVSIPLLVIITIAVGCYCARPRFQDDCEGNPLRFLVLFAATPLALAFVSSWLLPYSIWGTRHLVIVFVPFFLLLSNIITGLSIPAIRTAVLTFLLLLTGYSFALDLRRTELPFSWCQWQPLIQHAMTTNPENIYVFEDDVAYHIWYDLGHKNGFDPGKVVEVQNLPDIKADPAYFLPRGFDGVAKINGADFAQSKFWIAYRAREFSESAQPLKTYLENGYRITEQHVVPARQENAILVLLEK